MKITTRPRHNNPDELELVIPDTDARRITAWKDATWREFHGYGAGTTEDVTPGHPMYGDLLALADFCDTIGDPRAFIFGTGYDRTNPDMTLLVASGGISRDYGDRRNLAITG